MADTPPEDTPAPAPRRRKPRNEGAAAGETGRRGRRKAVPADEAKPKATRKAPARKTQPKTATEKVARVVKPRARKAAATIKSGVDEAGKPANRTRILVGAAAAAVSIAAGVAATLGRRKIAKVSGDVMEAVGDKVDQVTRKDEPGPGEA